MTGLVAAAHAGPAEFHEPFDGVLQSHVESGFVDYAGVARDARFSEYLERIKAAPDDSWSNTERLAFFINAYNALSIKGILDGHSPSSLLGRLKFFKRLKYEVGGQRIDLLHLERKIIIPLGEPRIHFAIVCASYSCPPLRSEAYAADRLEAQLEQQARLFVNDEQRNQFDRSRKRAKVSKIFDWYEDEFEDAAGGVQEYLARYVDDETLKAELLQQSYRVKHLKYNWSLNGTPPGA